jgi:CheY-like chemotaxis protein
VRIRDTGTGIAPDILPRVFDMFEQAAPLLERSTGGLGIGLTLARRIVGMHGGRIGVSSAGADEGTEVEIHLPSTLTPLFPGLVRKIDVDAGTVGEALDRLGSPWHPRCILLDLRMPRMCGREFRRLQLQDPALACIPVVVHSAEEAAEQEAADLGATGFLAKTARVITAAAAIMVVVFLAFVASPEVFLKLFGIGLASAIFLDATLVRMVLVPAVMQLLGPRNWWIPDWLERILPRIDVESREPQAASSQS